MPLEPNVLEPFHCSGTRLGGGWRLSGHRLSALSKNGNIVASQYIYIYIYIYIYLNGHLLFHRKNLVQCWIVRTKLGLLRFLDPKTTIQKIVLMLNAVRGVVCSQIERYFPGTIVSTNLPQGEVVLRPEDQAVTPSLLTVKTKIQVS